ncbi:MAG: GNAT family N-acetyltransferase [Puia sp.]|nr:GNAT family N-acetyltransferase [Puia sp.]
MNLTWTSAPFDQLTPAELYRILTLRSEVFVVEQNCLFLDMDNKDQRAVHLMGRRQDELLAYARILPPGISYAESSIGRIVVSPISRGMGLGRPLLTKAINTLYQLYGQVDIKIGAQLYLKNFYESFGFVQSGEMYLEDGIQHIEMIMPAK